MEKQKYVYLVRQTQPAEYYDEKTIAVFDTKEQDEKLACALNKEYGKGCEFDDDGKVIEQVGDYDTWHYYDVDCQELNPDLKKYWNI